MCGITGLSLRYHDLGVDRISCKILLWQGQTKEVQTAMRKKGLQLESEQNLKEVGIPCYNEITKQKL